MKQPKQIVRVLDALKQGARTCREVSEGAELPVSTCSYWLHELMVMGTIRKAGQGKAPNGRTFNEYELVKQ